MAVSNTHERIFNCSVSKAGDLIDGLGSDNDLLWPSGRWPSMELDRPLSVDAEGGHGPIRYFVEEYEPGRSVRFRFTQPQGFVGTHTFGLEEVESETVQLRHEILMDLQGSARLSWPLVFRWLHDALMEDALDRAEAYALDISVEPRAWSLRVRLLRWLIGRLTD